ncbi:MAG: YbgC/FadM family acyl-CoA thioesterase [Acidisphaera sp.]|nr:YbgC/FadM family acyl-CoA thioesterase [Acidisphaera sp.]
MLAEGRHRYLIRVYYEDTDAGGIVYHASYLRFAERARTEALRDLGVPHAELVEQHGLIFVVRRVKVDYVRPARIDDALVVVTQPTTLGAASLGLRQVFQRPHVLQGAHVVQGVAQDEVLARAEVSLACVRVDGNGPARMPARWHEALAALAAAEGTTRSKE